KKKKLAKEEKAVEKTESRQAKTENQETEIVSDTSVKDSSPVTDSETETVSSEETVKVAKAAHIRSKKYQTAKKKVDALKLYSIKDAIKLVKDTSLSKFDGKVEAHVTIFDLGNVGEITFPHLETSTKKIVVLNDAILAEIKEGKVNFDVLIATPVTMPKLLPFARLLGPKGLMPNPKSGTLTDKPEEAVKKLSVAKAVVKTEKKAPVIHMVIGKVSQAEKELEANLNELIKVIKAPKIKKLTLCATMGPGVKVLIEK
ncbi:hypothetical protein KKD37_03525, partial [Patescibacteria group bacterium]|nr:hypothetical protein [Patescibacteria group bacterium]